MYSALILSLGIYGATPKVDSIDRLVSKLSDDPLWENGIFPSVELPSKSTPEQIIEKIFKTVSFEKGKVTSYTILEQKRVKIAGSLPDSYTAALVKTNLGGKIILFKCLNSSSWWSRVYSVD